MRDFPEWSEDFTEDLEDTEGEKVEGTYCGKEKKRDTARVRVPRIFEGNSQGGDLSAPETNSQREDPRTFKEPMERWRVQKKWKGKKKKKDGKRKVKYRRSSLWKKAKERIASFLAAKWKEEEEEKKGRKSKNNTPKQDKSWASREDCYFSFCLWRETGCVSTPQQKHCSKGQR